MSAWNDFVKKLYTEKKNINPLFKFKDALIEAAKLYKKNSAPSKKAKTVANKRTKKNRTIKNRRR